MNPTSRNVLKLLLLGELGLVLLHCLWLVCRTIPGVYLFNLNLESSVPTWFSTLQLAGIAALAGGRWLLDGRSGARSRWPWGVIAAAFLFLSLDEFVQIHEIIDRRFDIFRYKWCYYYALGIALVAPPLFLFLRERLGPMMRQFLLGCAILVTGAMGMEMVEYLLVGLDMKWQGFYRLEIIVEELCEMAGASVILCSLLEEFTRRPGWTPLREASSRRQASSTREERVVCQ